MTKTNGRRADGTRCVGCSASVQTRRRGKGGSALLRRGTARSASRALGAELGCVSVGRSNGAARLGRLGRPAQGGARGLHARAAREQERSGVPGRRGLEQGEWRERLGERENRGERESREAAAAVWLESQSEWRA
jgi:hypothetical protein